METLKKLSSEEHKHINSKLALIDVRRIHQVAFNKSLSFQVLSFHLEKKSFSNSIDLDASANCVE